MSEQDVKRYDVHVRGDCGQRGCNPFPDSFESADGIWVDYIDHVRIVQELKAENTRAVLRYTVKGFQAGENATAKYWRERAEAAEKALHDEG